MKIYFSEALDNIDDTCYTINTDEGIKGFYNSVECPSPYCSEELVIKDTCGRMMPVAMDEVSQLIDALTLALDAYTELEDIQDYVSSAKMYINEESDVEHEVKSVSYNNCGATCNR